MLNTLDLFAGIGGFSLGLERTGGFRTAAFCEIDKKAQLVLKKHWPDTPIFDDVSALTKDLIDETVGVPIHVITGGFPCQDISLAGKGAGLAGERSGLWFQFHRLIKEIQPRYAIIENVSALRSRGLDAVLCGLAEIGYDAEWHCIPAAAVGAPHRRDRVWIVAYPASIGRGEERPHTGGRGQGDSAQGRGGSGSLFSGDGATGDVAYAKGAGRTGGRAGRGHPQDGEVLDLLPANGGEAMANAEGRSVGDVGEDIGSSGGEVHAPSNASSTCGRTDRPEDGAPVADAHGARLEGRQEAGDAGGLWPRLQQQLERCVDGVGATWAVEPDVGRVAHGVPGRVDRLKQLGNAVVPQIPQILGEAILDWEKSRVSA
jgi:DNA (cytosine-5)-methyltransferase 1